MSFFELQISIFGSCCQTPPSARIGRFSGHFGSHFAAPICVLCTPVSRAALGDLAIFESMVHARFGCFFPFCPPCFRPTFQESLKRSSRGWRGFCGSLLIASFDVIVGATRLKFCFVSERSSRGWRGFLKVSLLTLFLDLVLVMFSFFRMQKPCEN